MSPVCHILHLLWQILSNFCPQFVTSHPCYDKFCPIFVPVCHIFWIFIHFLCIKCIFWYFVPFLSHFLSHGTNFVTFSTPQKPSNTKGFRICPKFVTFFKILSPVCHVFVTSINRVVMRFMHKIYINVTNIYKSLTKFF